MPEGGDAATVQQICCECGVRDGAVVQQICCEYGVRDGAGVGDIHGGSDCEVRAKRSGTTG